MAKNKRHDEFESHRDLLERLNVEADRQLGSVATRGSALSSRATILVASSSLSGALQTAVAMQSIWGAIAAMGAVLAALAGLAALVMRRGPEVGIEEVKNTAWCQTPAEGLHTLIYRKLDVIRADERALHARHRWVMAGFALLTAALICTAVGVVVINVK